MNDTPLKALRECGQSIWLDNLHRKMIREGELERLIREDGVTGVTSNPKIFKKAIADSTDYDEAIDAAVERGTPVEQIYEQLAVRDVRDAADLLLPVYERSAATDGFVSLEVSPSLARDTDATIHEAQRLWNAVARPNVLIKIPATREGLPAIEESLAAGINVNVTLLFSLVRYGDVYRAWTRGLERLRDRGASLRVASFASFFLSRIDSKVDARLDRVRGALPGADEPRLLRGEVAIACARLAYQSWLRRQRSERWARLEAAGARPQRLLWASTSTKDPDYSDVRYVEALIGPDTVTTLPEETLRAFRDHGHVDGPTIGRRVKNARVVLKTLEQIGLDLQAVTDELVEEGVEKFREPFDEMLRQLERRAAATAVQAPG